MTLLEGLPESSGGRIRSFPQPTSSSPWLSTLRYHLEMNRPIDGGGSETTHLSDIINKSINQWSAVVIFSCVAWWQPYRKPAKSVVIAEFGYMETCWKR
jgi:hypothetical protein